MSKAVESRSTFHEVQAFRQWWVWMVVGGVAALAWAAFVVQILLGQRFGNRPAPDIVIWILGLSLGFALPVLLLEFRLIVTVDESVVTIWFFPLRRRRISFDQIRSCEARTYRPVREYGGWGIRWAPKGGWAYTVFGTGGAQLELANGKRTLIGSQRPEELAEAIRSRLPRRDAGPR